MTDQYLLHMRNKMAAQYNDRSIYKMSFTLAHIPSFWSLVSIAGMLTFISVSFFAFSQYSQEPLIGEVSIFADTAAVPDMFTSMSACERHTKARLEQASNQIRIKVDHVKAGLFYISANDTTTIIRCFPLANGRNHIFIASSGHNQESVNTTIATLYHSIALR